MKMAELRDLCRTLKYDRVETYLQSGNLILNTQEGVSKLARRLSSAICDEFGYSDVTVLPWTADELEGLIEDNPFVDQRCDASKLHVTFLQEDPGEDAIVGLGPDDFLPDRFAPGVEAVYVHCPKGYGRTKLNNAFFERKLHVRGTTRNWKTTKKLCELARE